MNATLRTARLVLEPLTDAHLRHEQELDADPEVMRYLTGRAGAPAEVGAAHRRRVRTAVASPGLGCWVGFHGPDFVGWWLLEPPDPDDPRAADGRQAGLGYRLLRRWWRQGLGAEGARELVRYGFAELRLDRIFAETMAVNAASRATMRTAGLRHVRTFVVDFPDPLPGTELGEVEYALTRAEFGARSN